MEFYGTKNETVVKTGQGNFYLIQSLDLAGEYAQWPELPEEFEKLSPGLCFDLEIPQAILDEED